MLDQETPRAAVRPSPAETTWQRTAPESRRRIASFVSRLAMMLGMLGMLALIALPGRRSAPEMLQLLQTVMFFAGVWSALFAWVAHEPPQPGRLNLWDEALAFTGLFLLVRILRTVVLGV